MSAMNNSSRLMIRTAFVAVTMVGVLATAFGAWACSPGGNSGPAETLVLGYTRSEAAGLVYIAEDRGFFAANGVSVVSKYYDTGVGSLDALLRNEIDIAGTAETPFIGKVFGKEAISVYATLDKGQYMFLVGRKDRGIRTVADLKGKRIGLPRGTLVEFYLGRFLNLNGLKMQDMTLVDAAPQGCVEAMEGGDLDGAAVWNPYANQIALQLGEKAAVLRLQSNQPAYALAVARNDWIASHRGVLGRSLRAIVQAEQYLLENPANARAIVQKKMNYDDGVMDRVWSDNQYSLVLHQSLVAAMEDQARWMISNNLTSEKEVPDFLHYVHVETLKETKPEAVNILR